MAAQTSQFKIKCALKWEFVQVTHANFSKWTYQPSIKTLHVLFWQKWQRGKFDHKFIPEFDGSASGPSVVKWMEKANLVCKMCQMKHLEYIVSLRLTSGVFAVYQQLKEEKEDFNQIKLALYSFCHGWILDQYIHLEKFSFATLSNSWSRLHFILNWGVRAAVFLFFLKPTTYFARHGVSHLLFYSFYINVIETWIRFIYKKKKGIRNTKIFSITSSFLLFFYLISP